MFTCTQQLHFPLRSRERLARHLAKQLPVGVLVVKSNHVAIVLGGKSPLDFVWKVVVVPKHEMQNCFILHLDTPLCKADSEDEDVELFEVERSSACVVGVNDSSSE